MQYFQLFIFLVVLALGVVVVSLEEIVKVLVFRALSSENGL